MSLNINRTKLNWKITNRGARLSESSRCRHLAAGQNYDRWRECTSSRDSIACYWGHRDYVCSSYCACRWRATACTPSARSLVSRLRPVFSESTPSHPLGVSASSEWSPFSSILSLEAFSDLGFSNLVFLHLILILGSGVVMRFWCCILMWLISVGKRVENERKSHIYKDWHDFFFFFLNSCTIGRFWFDFFF